MEEQRGRRLLALREYLDGYFENENIVVNTRLSDFEAFQKSVGDGHFDGNFLPKKHLKNFIFCQIMLYPFNSDNILDTAIELNMIYRIYRHSGRWQTRQGTEFLNADR